MILHGFASVDYIFHHVCFIIAGLIIRSSCMLPFNAAVMMAMEITTPLLNFGLLYRHRGLSICAAAVSGSFFLFFYIALRLVLNSWAAVELVRNRNEYLF